MTITEYSVSEFRPFRQGTYQLRGFHLRARFAPIPKIRRARPAHARRRMRTRRNRRARVRIQAYRPLKLEKKERIAGETRHPRRPVDASASLLAWRIT